MAAHGEEHGNFHGKTLFIRNLPFTSTNDSLEKVFSDIGPVKQCFVVGNKETGKCRGFGYVKYTMLEDAQKALASIKKVDGRAVQIMFANRKEKKKRFGRPQPPPKDDDDEQEDDIKPEIAEIKEDPEVKEEPEVKEDPKEALKKANSASKKARLEKVKKESTAHNEGRRARLIVRNLSFECSESQLSTAFAPYGDIVEVHIPVKGSKKFGFGFVQFSNKAEAGMAVKELNGKPILDRKVAIDFTLPKEKFEQKMSAQAKVKADAASDGTEDDDDDDDAGNDDDEDTDDSMDQDEIKEENDDVKEEPEDSEDEDEEETDDDDEMKASSDSSDEESKGSDDDDEDEDDDDDNSAEEKGTNKLERSTDVNQGRTVFIRNVSYDAEDEAIEEYFSQFGAVRFARCVTDRTTGMSRGTAFVQFATKESAELCLKGSAQSGQHFLAGRELLVTMAVDRPEAQNLKKEKKKMPKDTRNLYLAREGMIRPGTEAAKDVPPADLVKRLKNDHMKRRKLTDQNTFISSTRLCIHNIPATVDDKALRTTVLKNMGDRKKSELATVKIMRDMARVNSEGKARSRGFAFVSFTTHEAALAALHRLNNNGSVFGPTKRPIVEFSIENRKALLMKEKRVEKSKMREIQAQEKEAMQGKTIQKGKFKGKGKGKPTPKPQTVDRTQQDKIARSMHSGPIGLPRHTGAKKRHKPRPSQTQTKAKKPKKFVHPAKANQPRRQREPKARQTMSRRNKGNKQSDNFDKLVSAHKQKILSSGVSF